MVWPLQRALYRILHAILRVVVRRINIPIPELISGPGSLEKLPALIQKSDVQHVLLVTDKGITRIGLINPLLNALKQAGVECTVFEDVQPNPSIHDVENGVMAYRDNNCDGIIAFGGGSPMDCAKVIGARVNNPEKSVLEMRGGFKVKKPLPPLFAVPTTAGTGSECSIGAMVSDTDKRDKFGLASPLVVPPYAVLDAQLMMGLPPHITAATGMDALTHAVEAYIGRWGTEFTNENAESAVEIIFRDLEAVYRDGSDLERRHNMAMASHRAALAFSRAMVGYVHAIAHQLGGLYGVPHGLANAIILPHVLEYSRANCEEQLARLAVVAGLGGQGESAELLSRGFIEKIREMNRSMNIPTTITELREADLPEIARRAVAEGNPAYPVPTLMNQGQCEGLLQKLLPDNISEQPQA